MQCIAQREQSAIAALFKRHGKTLKRIIYQVLQDEAEAEDVLQESILQIWREAKATPPRWANQLGWIDHDCAAPRDRSRAPARGLFASERSLRSCISKPNRARGCRATPKR